MRIAIIDLGTNTFNLIIAEVFSNKRFKQIYETKLPVMLGQGGINNNYIVPGALKRGIKTLKQYKKITEKYRSDKLIAIATSAIREASNGQDFIEKAKKQAGIAVEIISGDREAELIYYGVREGVKMSHRKSLIMDIGGGSTELIIADKNKIFWKKSFLLGAARLLDKIKPSDPISDQEIKRIENYLLKELLPLFSAVKKHPVAELIGSSGSFESLAEMIVCRFYSPSVLEGKTEYDFDLGDCSKIYKLIVKSTRAERMKMKGLIKMRVDMIVVSAIFVNLIVRKLKIKKIRLSTYSLKEGVIVGMV